ncbi:MAG: hypothetical protein ACREON_20025 [Gemmatimonadaceae bacterium]
MTPNRVDHGPAAPSLTVAGERLQPARSARTHRLVETMEERTVMNAPNTWGSLRRENR